MSVILMWVQIQQLNGFCIYAGRKIKQDRHCSLMSQGNGGSLMVCDTATLLCFRRLIEFAAHFRLWHNWVVITLFFFTLDRVMSLSIITLCWPAKWCCFAEFSKIFVTCYSNMQFDYYASKNTHKMLKSFMWIQKNF